MAQSSANLDALDVYSAQRYVFGIARSVSGLNTEDFTDALKRRSFDEAEMKIDTLREDAQDLVNDMREEEPEEAVNNDMSLAKAAIAHAEAFGKLLPELKNIVALCRNQPDENSNTPELDAAFDKIFEDPEVLNKSYIYDQYDANVGLNSAKRPGMLGAAVLRVKQNGVKLAMAADCNTRMNYVHPRIGAALAVALAGRKVAMSGATPLAITDCLNYGNPQNPEVMWQFAQGCEGIKQACAALNTPVISGNVSLYNETGGVSIQPTPAIVCVGTNEGEIIPSDFCASGVSVYLVGDEVRADRVTHRLTQNRVLLRTQRPVLTSHPRQPGVRDPLGLSPRVSRMDTAVVVAHRGLHTQSEDLRVAGLGERRGLQAR